MCVCVCVCVFIIHFHSCEVLEKKSQEYSKKVQDGKTTQKIFYGLSWDIKGLEELLHSGRQLKVDISV